MPGGDGTGPLGQGPMTGRARGYCAGFPEPGFWRGRGIGRGFNRRFFRTNQYIPYNRPYQSENEEKDYLETLIKDLEQRLDELRKKVNDISNKPKE